jgi:hypothetical protein
MNYCTKCGKEITQDGNFCHSCGGKLKLQDNEQFIETSLEDFKNFIGKKSDVYVRKFNKFNIGGVDQFSATWHWPAFFLSFISMPFLWFLYRKLYLWSIIFFVIYGFLAPIITWIFYDFSLISFNITTLIPIIFLSISLLITPPIVTNYFYYRHVKKKILLLRSINTSSDISQELKGIGGVNKWVLKVIYIVLSLIILVILSIVGYFAYKDMQYKEEVQKREEVNRMIEQRRIEAERLEKQREMERYIEEQKKKYSELLRKAYYNGKESNIPCSVDMEAVMNLHNNTKLASYVGKFCNLGKQNKKIKNETYENSLLDRELKKFHEEMKKDLY